MEETINEVAAQDSSPMAHVPMSTGELYSTVEWQKPETELKHTEPESVKESDAEVQEQKESVKETKADTKKETKATEDTIDRLDQHPRFKQVINEKNELKKQIEGLQKRVDDILIAKEKQVTIDDLDNDTVFKEMSDRPKEFLNKFKENITQNLLNEIEQKTQQELTKSKIVQDYEKYAKDNPDFDELWNNGEIQKFMNDNPGNTAKSAHMLMTQEKRETQRQAEIEKRIQEEVEKKVAEERDKIKKSFAAKQGASVLSSTPAKPPTAQSSNMDLQDTKKFGGKTSVLAARLAALRNASG